MLDNPEIANVLQPWSTWFADDDGFHRSSFRDTMTFSKAEICAIHPNLPGLIQHLSMVRGVRNDVLMSTLALWSMPSVEVRTLNGERAAIFHIYKIDVMRDSVLFTAEHTFFEECRLDDSSAKSRVYKNVCIVHPEVSRSWLDQHYPGWYERYNVTRSLSMDPTKSGFYIFDKQTSQSIESLPDNIGDYA